MSEQNLIGWHVEAIEHRTREWLGEGHEVRRTVYFVVAADGRNVISHNFDREDYARLFAAGPEMLTALKVAQAAEEHYRFCEDCDQDDGILCDTGESLLAQAEALRVDAIAKAEGPTR